MRQSETVISFNFSDFWKYTQTTCNIDVFGSYVASKLAPFHKYLFNILVVSRDKCMISYVFGCTSWGIVRQLCKDWDYRFGKFSNCSPSQTSFVDIYADNYTYEGKHLTISRPTQYSRWKDFYKRLKTRKKVYHSKHNLM